jgi:murein L,D-transpeptidase YcbB/YkuD
MTNSSERRTSGPSCAAARKLTLAAAVASGLAAGAIAFAAPGSLEGQEPVREALRGRVAVLRASSEPEVAGTRIRFPLAVAGLYERHEARPLWGRSAARELPAALVGLAADGLLPASYHLSALTALAGTPAPGDLADLEVVRTDALLLAVHDLRFGRTRRPERPAGLSVEALTGLPEAEIRDLMRAADLPARIRGLRPDHFVYTGLLEGLRELRGVARTGGWEPLPGGPALRVGQSDPRVSALRRRLRARANDAVEAPPDDSTFDAGLEAAVRTFQAAHGLNRDGVVGPATLAALNVPIDARIDQVRVNLERVRGSRGDLADTALVVNIPGARVYLVHGSDVAFEARAIVGQTNTPTPAFTATLRTVELSPAWHVPAGIVGEVLDAVRRSRGYLALEGMRVVDANGKVVDPATIDFDRFTARTFPYSFRQEPGPRNPLGRLKFGLPNRYDVYLHDTPARDLFEREVRASSHGCVRVEHPVRLAELVLADPAWRADALDEAIAGGQRRVIPLRRPIAVRLVYWTASADSRGTLYLYRDLYGRDAALLAELDRP